MADWSVGVQAPADRVGNVRAVPTNASVCLFSPPFGVAPQILVCAIASDTHPMRRKGALAKVNEPGAQMHESRCARENQEFHTVKLD